MRKNESGTLAHPGLWGWLRPCCLMGQAWEKHASCLFCVVCICYFIFVFCYLIVKGIQHFQTFAFSWTSSILLCTYCRRTLISNRRLWRSMHHVTHLAEIAKVVLGNIKQHTEMGNRYYALFHIPQHLPFFKGKITWLLKLAKCLVSLWNIDFYKMAYIKQIFKLQNHETSRAVHFPFPFTSI